MLDLLARDARQHRGADRDLQLREPDPAAGRRARSPIAARDAGVDGVLVLDLPIEEAGELPEHAGRAAGLIQSSCSARRRPTSGCGRPRRSAAASCTGSRGLASPARATELPTGAEAMVRAHPRASATLPVALGFGISKPEHVREVGQ